MVGENEEKSVEQKLAEAEQKLKDTAKQFNLPVEKLKEWKATFHRVIKVDLNGDLFLIRPITRLEWKGLLAEVKIGASLSEEERRIQMDEIWVRRCLLAPSGQTYEDTRGGTVGSLVQAIQFYSNFLPPDLVIASTEEI
jgi:hypothetical protein